MRLYDMISSRRRHGALRWAVLAGTVLAGTVLAGGQVTQAQALEWRPGDGEKGTAQSEERTLERMEYFYQRVTYPNGTIPPGARAKAWRYAQERMPLYAADGRTPAAGGVTGAAGLSGAAGGTAAAYTWKNIGPFNIGGRIAAVAINPKNAATMLIGAADGGIWRTLDGGRSWHSVSDALPVQAIGALAWNPVDSAVVYAGTGEAVFAQRTFDGGGMFRSGDGGTTWTEIGAGTLPAFARAGDIAVNPVNPAVLYVTIPDGVRADSLEGVWKSTDAGDTWTQVFHGKTRGLAVNPQQPDIVYTAASAMFSGGVTAAEGMFRSTDAGATWTRLDVGVDPAIMGRASIALCAQHPEVLYIGVAPVFSATSRIMVGVFKSTDGGDSWSRCPVPYDYQDAQGWYDNFMGVRPDNPDVVWAGGVSLIRSDDGGAHWTRIPDWYTGGVLHVDQHAVAFDPTDYDRICVGNDGGFFIISQAGSKVEKSDLGLSITQFVGGAMHPATDALLFGGTQDNSTMVGRDGSAAIVLGGDGGNAFVNPLAPNIMHASQQNCRLWRSEDAGGTWVSAMGGLPIESSLFYVEYAMDPAAPSTLYLGTYRMYKTNDGGRSWAMVRDMLFQSPTGGAYYISSVFVPSYGGGTVLAGASSGAVGISRDAGATWTVVTDSLPAAYCSSVRSFEPGVLYATYSRYGVDKVWRSDDTGATWKSLNGNLPDIPANDIIALDGRLILGTDLGAFISDDGGASWQRFGSGMPAVSVQKLKYNPATGTLRAITHGRGMFDCAWATPAAQPPVFVSAPDTAPRELGQRFIYAPVVSAYPPAHFALEEGPPGAAIDSVLGTVEWTVGPTPARFTLRAANAQGSAQQTFTVGPLAAPAADWTMLSSAPMGSFANSIDLATDGAFWVARDSGRLSRSVDGGRSWTEHHVPGNDCNILTVCAFDAGTAIAGTNDGRILRTGDGGATWTVQLERVNAQFGNIHFWNGSEGIAVSRGQRDSADIFMTADGGGAWTLQAPRFNVRQVSANTLHFFDRQAGWFAGTNTDSYTPRNAVVLRTTDGGARWTSYDAGTRSVSDIAFLSATKGYLTDNVQGRMRRSTSGYAWNTTYYPMNGSRTLAVWADTATRTIWVVSDSAAWYSRNEGNAWTRTQLVLDGPMHAAVFADSARGYVISRRGTLQQLARNPFVVSVPAPAGAPSSLAIGGAYPNPLGVGQDACIVPFRLGAAARITVTVSDAAGRLAATLADDVFPAGTHAAVWDASAFPNGVYFVTVTGGREQAVGRIAILR